MADTDTTISQVNLARILDSQDVEPVLQGKSKTQEEEGKVFEDWETATFRSKVAQRIREEIKKTESQVPKSEEYLEDFAFTKATSRKEYLDLVAGVLIYVAEFNSRRSKATDKEDVEKTKEDESVMESC